MKSISLTIILIAFCVSIHAEGMGEWTADTVATDSSVSAMAATEWQLSAADSLEMRSLRLGTETTDGLKDMKRYLNRYQGWMISGMLTGLVFLDWTLFAAALSLFLEGEDGIASPVLLIPSAVMGGISALSFVNAHRNAVRARNCAPDLTTYKVKRLRKTGKTMAIVAGVNIATVLILNAALTADSDLRGYMFPSVPLTALSFYYFIKASEKERKASLSVGATTLYEPRSINRFTPCPALSLSFSF